MKERIKRIGKRCYTVLCTPVAGAAVLLCCCCIFISLLLGVIRNLTLWKYMVTLPEPEHCALCADDRTVRDAPCLVKLETGELKPLSENLSVPQDARYINPYLFCRDCRANIAETVDAVDIYYTGYVLADLHDLAHIRTYAVSGGAEYEIRGCTVTVSEKKHEFALSLSDTRT